MDRLVRPIAALLLCLGFLAGGALLYAQQADSGAPKGYPLVGQSSPFG